ncbi:MAG: LamG-like jellyroll fold domain-containing protein [Pyrinomonadaceae bacterium]
MKRYNAVFYIFLLVLVFPSFVERASSQSCTPAPAGLISWWRADGNASDSRSGNHGTLVGGATFASGIVGAAFSFDGDDDRVEVPTNTTLDPPTGHVTAEAWIYPTLPFPGGGSIINKRTIANNAGYSLERSASKTLYWAVPIGGHFIFISSVAAVPDNSWTHVAGTYDGTTLRIYVNGVDAGSVIHTVGGPVSPTTGKLVIGEHIANEINFKGLIDEPSVYDRALSATEIASIHAAGPAGKCQTTPEPTPTPIVDTIAGNGTPGFSGDGGAALDAAMSQPQGIAVAPDGTIYFADNGNFRIRKIDTSGVISTIAGTGVADDTGDGGPAIDATLSLLLSISLDPASNNLDLSDTNTHRIRRIDLNAGTIHAFAGTGTIGFLGDGGPAIFARLRRSQGVSVAPDGSVIIADTGNCRIRRVSGGVITPIAGSGVCESSGNGSPAILAGFDAPRRVKVDADGNVFVLDNNNTSTNDNNTIRRIDAVTGVIDMVAGGGVTVPGSGPATTMNIGNVQDMAFDALGNLYIAALARVYRVDGTSGFLSPFAGTGAFGFSGDGGPAIDAEFNFISAVGFRGETVILSDGLNNRLRAVNFAQTAICPTSDPVAINGDLIISGSTATINLTCITSVSGDLILTDNQAAGVLDLGALETVGGNVNISDNTPAGDLDLGSLETVSGNLEIQSNPAAGNLDLGSLTEVGGTIQVTGNSSAGNLHLGSLTTVSGDLAINANGSCTTVNLALLATVTGDESVESCGSGSFSLGSGAPAGDLILDLSGYTTASGTTAGGETLVSNETAEAVMSVQLPEGAFTTPVNFSITHHDPATLDPEVGTLPGGGQGTIDPVAAYSFNFDIPLLQQEATLVFEVLLDGLDAETRGSLIEAIVAANATLATRSDKPGASYQAFPVCPIGIAPTAGGCVLVETLDENREPTNDPPAVIRFSGVTGHFSTWAVVRLSAPTAASANISGRVTDAGGRGVSRAFVTAVSTAGQTFQGLTNTFGYYRLADLPAGEGYVVTVSARRNQFDNATQFVDLSTDVTDLDFHAR